MRTRDYIKVDLHMFENRKIKIIRSKADGVSMVLFWMDLLQLALDSGIEDVVRYDITRPYTTKELASITNTSERIVIKSLVLFEELSMIYLRTGNIIIKNWLKYQYGDDMELEQDAKS